MKLIKGNVYEVIKDIFDDDMRIGAQYQLINISEDSVTLRRFYNGRLIRSYGIIGKIYFFSGVFKLAGPKLKRKRI